MRVVVGLSGGVDSSVASYLLKKEGHEVIGLTFQFQSCGKDDAVQQARAVADKLNFPHYIIDVRKDFEEGVLKNSWNLYSNSRTPNPCAFCNQFVKFPSLLKYAGIVNADYVATGHYAISDNGLYRGKDGSKDQSYFLYSLKDVDRIKFPLGSNTI